MPKWLEAFIAAEGWVISQMTWTTFLFTVLFIVFVVFIYNLQTDKNNTYDFRDLFLDEQTRKASLTNHIIIAMAVMAIWTVIFLASKDRDITEMVLGVLGIFVLGKEVKRGINVFDQRGAANTNISTGEEDGHQRTRDKDRVWR